MCVCGPSQVTEDYFGDHLASAADVSPCAHVALKYRAEGVLVRDVEHSESGHDLVYFHRIRIGAEETVGLPAHYDASQGFYDRAIERPHRFRLPQVAAFRLVLRYHQAHETLVAKVVVEGELNDAANRVDRRQVIE